MLDEVKKIDESLESKAGDTVARFSKTLVNSIQPEVKKAKEELYNLTVNISDKTMGINSKMIEISDKLINFRVGRAMREYVYTGIICLVIGVFGTLRVTQQCYGGLLKKSYVKEIELAKNEGCNEYQRHLVQDNSGFINILKLEKEYVKNHKKSFNDSDTYLQSLNQQIIDLSSLENFMDKQ